MGQTAFVRGVLRVWSRLPRAARLFVIVVLAATSSLAPLIGRTAAADQHFLYAAIDYQIVIYDIDQGHAVVRKLDMPNLRNPRGMQACAATHTLYVSFKHKTESKGVLVAINLLNDQVLWQKSFPQEMDAFSLTLDCKKLYAATGESQTKPYDWVIDATNGNIITTVTASPAGGNHNTVVGASGTYAYLSSLKYEYLTLVDTKTDQIVRKVGPFSGGIRPFVVNGTDTYAFVNVNGLQGFEVADIRTGKVIHQVKLDPQVAHANYPNPVHGIGLTADETELWQTGADSRVYVFDSTVMPPKQIASVPVSSLPKWITFSIDNRYVYTGTGDVIDRQQRKVVAQITKAKRQLEVDFANGVVVRAANMYALGYVGAAASPSPLPSVAPSGTPSPLPSAAPSGTPSPSSSAAPSPAPSRRPEGYLPYVEQGR